jgi:hypothetical protein
VTDRARREYATVMRRRYQSADKRERGRLLDEYCRTTGCHRKAAIRRLRRAPGPRRRAPGRPTQYAPQELAAILELTALTTHHGLVLAPAVRAAPTRASAATLDRLLRPYPP